MTPVKIIRGARSDGVALTFSPPGTIEATGREEGLKRWVQGPIETGNAEEGLITTMPYRGRFGPMR